MTFDDIIKVPYTTNPRMEKYEGPLLSDPDQHYFLEKEKELLFQGENIWFQSDLAYKHKLVYRATQVLGIDPLYDIIKLGLKIKEDIVLMRRGILEAAFVAFPSGWKPGSKQGLTLEQIHAPVADGDNLRRYSNRLSQLMCKDINYHRSVWTLTTLKYLSAYPDYKHPEPQSLNDIWIRTEHQKTFTIEKDISSGFLINVHMTPYLSLTEEIRNKIKRAVSSMTENVLTYKNLHKIKHLIINHDS